MRHLYKSIFLSILFIFSFVAIYSQPTPFPCEDKFYFFQKNGGNGALSTIENYTSSTPIITPICNMSGTIHNCMGANNIDNFLYYSITNKLVRLGANCDTASVCFNLPLRSNGCFDDLGNYWFVGSLGLYELDINTCNYLKGPLNIGATSGSALIYNTRNTHLYYNVNGSLLEIDTAGLLIRKIILISYPGGPPIPGFGGVAFGTDGRLYGVGNDYLGVMSLDISDSISLVSKLDPVPTPNESDMSSFTCLEVHINATNITCFNKNDGTATARPSYKAKSPCTFLWSPGGKTAQTISGLSVGTYSVFVTDSNGNIDTAVTTITQPSAFSLSVSPPIAINPGDSTTLTAIASGGSPGYKYNWNNGVSTGNIFEFVPSVTTTCTVVASDSRACNQTAFIKVTLKGTSCDSLFVPDSFSPNQDEHNDFLFVRGAYENCIKDFDFKIFNRWGEQVFETNNINEGWNGKYKDKAANEGLFVYYLAGIKNNLPFALKGTIVLVR